MTSNSKQLILRKKGRRRRETGEKLANTRFPFELYFPRINLNNLLGDPVPS